MHEDDLVDDELDNDLDESDADQENQDDDLGDQDQDDDQHDDEDELVISIGGEAPAPKDVDDFNGQPAPDWVKQMRKENRELKRQLKTSPSAQQEQAKQEVTLGKKPTLDDHDYDADAYEQALDSWHDKKREYDQQEQSRKSEQENAEKQWETVISDFEQKKVGLKVSDFEEAEDTIKDSLSVVQQGILLQGAENSARVVYALGKNPKRLKEIASITDPVKFAFALAKLETQMKDNRRKAETPPEKGIRGSANISGGKDSKLEALEREAEKTGDRSKIIAHKRSLKQKSK